MSTLTKSTKGNLGVYRGKESKDLKEMGIIYGGILAAFGLLQQIRFKASTISGSRPSKVGLIIVASILKLAEVELDIGIVSR